MKHIDSILTDIAVKHLRIPTLAARRSDRLDFHCVSVWGVRDALLAAFDAGAAGALPRPEPVGELPPPYDAYEIHGVAFVNTERHDLRTGRRRRCRNVDPVRARSRPRGGSDRRFPHARICRGGLRTHHGPSLPRRREILRRVAHHREARRCAASPGAGEMIVESAS